MTTEQKVSDRSIKNEFNECNLSKEDLIKEIEKLKAEKEELKNENEELKVENEELKNENEELRKINTYDPCEKVFSISDLRLLILSYSLEKKKLINILNPKKYSDTIAELTEDQLERMEKLTINSKVTDILYISDERGSWICKALGKNRATCGDIIEYLRKYNNLSKYDSYTKLIKGHRLRRPFAALRHLMEAEGWDVSVIFR